ncbi:MAG: hypothetical protein C0595_14975 [Marinilabiliales bacterium]|nr:MAG: hypothetical protein C0595_14975 [Marinilabiliales bacterium]
MRTIIKSCECYRGTYGKPYLLRLVFETTLQETCKLEADNVCKCDSWFPRNNHVLIKYNIVCGGKFSSEMKLIQKSIIVDVSSIQSDDFDIDLVLTNSAGLHDFRTYSFSELKEDILINKHATA